MRVAIVGCRPPPPAFRASHARGYRLLLDSLASFITTLRPGDVVVSGGAEGVDTVAAHLAVARGLEIVVFKPDYARYGQSAPLERNALIVGASDEVHAWPAPWSRGTHDTIRRAFAAGKRVVVHGASSW